MRRLISCVGGGYGGWRVLKLFTYSSSDNLVVCLLCMLKDLIMCKRDKCSF